MKPIIFTLLALFAVAPCLAAEVEVIDVDTSDVVEAETSTNSAVASVRTVVKRTWNALESNMSDIKTRLARLKTDYHEREALAVIEDLSKCIALLNEKGELHTVCTEAASFAREEISFARSKYGDPDVPARTRERWKNHEKKATEILEGILDQVSMINDAKQRLLKNKKLVEAEQLYIARALRLDELEAIQSAIKDVILQINALSEDLEKNFAMSL